MYLVYCFPIEIEFNLRNFQKKKKKVKFNQVKVNLEISKFRLKFKRI